MARFVQDQNNSVYIPRGLMLIDPAERGLRIVSFANDNVLKFVGTNIGECESAKTIGEGCRELIDTLCCNLVLSFPKNSFNNKLCHQYH